MGQILSFGIVGNHGFLVHAVKSDQTSPIHDTYGKAFQCRRKSHALDWNRKRDGHEDLDRRQVVQPTEAIRSDNNSLELQETVFVSVASQRWQYIRDTQILSWLADGALRTLGLGSATIG
jgi:hypothetical protein